MDIFNLMLGATLMFIAIVVIAVMVTAMIIMPIVRVIKGSYYCYRCSKRYKLKGKNKGFHVEAKCPNCHNTLYSDYFRDIGGFFN